MFTIFWTNVFLLLQSLMACLTPFLSGQKHEGQNFIFVDGTEEAARRLYVFPRAISQIRHAQTFADRNPIKSWESKLFETGRARSKFPRAKEYKDVLQVLHIPDGNLV